MNSPDFKSIEFLIFFSCINQVSIFDIAFLDILKVYMSLDLLGNAVGCQSKRSWFGFSKFCALLYYYPSNHQKQIGWHPQGEIPKTHGVFQS